MKSDLPYLDYILGEIAAIEEFTVGGRAPFFESRLVQYATVRALQTLAEATKRLSPESKSAHLEVPWARISAFRNALVHEYDRLDLELVWDVVDCSLPPLKEAVSLMRATASPSTLGPELGDDA